MKQIIRVGTLPNGERIETELHVPSGPIPYLGFEVQEIDGYRCLVGLYRRGEHKALERQILADIKILGE